MDLIIKEEEVPREGVKVTRNYKYARWTNGSIMYGSDDESKLVGEKDQADYDLIQSNLSDVFEKKLAGRNKISI